MLSSPVAPTRTTLELCSVEYLHPMLLSAQDRHWAGTLLLGLFRSSKSISELLALKQVLSLWAGQHWPGSTGCSDAFVQPCCAWHPPTCFYRMIHSFSAFICVFTCWPWWSLSSPQISSHPLRSRRTLFLGKDSCLWLGNQYRENKCRGLNFFYIIRLFYSDHFHNRLDK